MLCSYEASTQVRGETCEVIQEAIVLIDLWRGSYNSSRDDVEHSLITERKDTRTRRRKVAKKNQDSLAGCHAYPGAQLLVIRHGENCRDLRPRIKTIGTHQIGTVNDLESRT